MNIGLFVDAYYPRINGVVTSVMMLKENLEKIGHTVYVFTTADPKAPKNEPNVYRLPSIPFAGAWRLGLPYHKGVVRKIRSLRLDLIHTHTEFSLGIFGRIMAKELGIPIIHTMHTIYEDYTHFITKTRALDFAAKPLARKLSRYLCNKTDMTIAPTEKMREMLRGYGVRNQIAVIPTGIDLGRFAPANYPADEVAALKAAYGLADTDRVLLYIGRVSKEKNIAEVLRGLCGYLPRHPRTKFLLIGDGPERESLQSLAKSLGIGGQVMFLGEKPWEQIGLFYQLGDVFVSASQSETQGLTYIEALAAGLPLVAKEDRCLNHVLYDGVNGFAFADKAGFTDALEAVLSDDAVLEGMSINALRSTAAFSAAAYAQAAIELYEKALAQKSRYVFAA